MLGGWEARKLGWTKVKKSYELSSFKLQAFKPSSFQAFKPPGLRPAYVVLRNTTRRLHYATSIRND
jgi:hypothetical protein